MRVTDYQLRAARSMVGLTVAELAELAKTSRDAIDNWEAGLSSPRQHTQDAVWSVLESKGVELIGERGVAMRDESVRRIVGPRAVYEFLDDVYTTVLQGGDICVTGVDEALFDKHYKPTGTQHFERMTALGDKIYMRCILREGDFNFAYDSYIKYRWMDKEKFDPSPMYVYNHKLAMLNLMKEQPDIIVVESATMAHAFRKQFDFIWDHCKEPPRSIKNG